VILFAICVRYPFATKADQPWGILNNGGLSQGGGSAWSPKRHRIALINHCFYWQLNLIGKILKGLCRTLKVQNWVPRQLQIDIEEK